MGPASAEAVGRTCRQCGELVVGEEELHKAVQLTEAVRQGAQLVALEPQTHQAGEATKAIRQVRQLITPDIQHLHTCTPTCLKWVVQENRFATTTIAICWHDRKQAHAV